MVKYLSMFWLAITAWALTLSSPQIHGTFARPQIFDRYGCEGANLSPSLVWQGAPDGTRSFAVTMFDPDAPTGHGWWHWILYDIPSSVRSLPEGAGTRGHSGLPAGAKQARNDYGEMGYGGPCPPKGATPHRYIVTLYALDIPRLPVSSRASALEILTAIRAHTIAQASIVARYGR